MNTRKKRQTYSPEFKENAVKVAIELNNHAQAARQLGVNYVALRNWIKLAGEINNGGLAKSLEETAKIKELEKKNKNLEIELEILKKATAYFAKDHLSKSTPGSKK